MVPTRLLIQLKTDQYKYSHLQMLETIARSCRDLDGEPIDVSHANGLLVEWPDQKRAHEAASMLQLEFTNIVIQGRRL